jgi:hypothetical protein
VGSSPAVSRTKIQQQNYYYYWVYASAGGLVLITKKGTRNASDKVYQLLAHGRWFSSGILASSTTKLVAMILLKYC